MNFIEKAKTIHGDRYDYSLVEYKNCDTKVKIICKVHGIFEQRPHDHISKKAGCPKCYFDRMGDRNRHTVEEFIKNAKIIFGDIYDYELVKEYTNNNQKFKIKCKEHGYFEKSWETHITLKQGCPVCSKIKKSKLQVLTNEEYIEKAKKVHGDRYDYTETEYVNAKTKVKIICKEHGIFEQRTYDHLNGSGCSKCKSEKISLCRNMGQEVFIKRAKEVHGDKYDYSLVDYVDSKTKVKIICKEHGIFEQISSDHLNGSGCSKCSIERKPQCQNYTNEEFIKIAKLVHGDKYDYSLVNYNGTEELIKIICKEHGIFEQKPHNHLGGSGCIICKSDSIKKLLTLTNEEFIERAKEVHGDKYDYSLVNYINSNIEVKIICKKHGIFQQKPNVHLQNSGCQKCSNGGYSSRPEKEIIQFIKQYYTQEILENNRKMIFPYELDIYLPDLKLAIEYNGLYWHCELEKDKKYHLMKTKMSEEVGIHLIHIYEDDWLYKPDIVKSRILNLLGKCERIYARKCDIREVSFNDSKEFLNINHLQGNCISKINLGLYYNNELVSLMTFGSLRKNLGQISKDGSYELLRFCNKLNTTVIGGANRLFEYFKNKYNPLKVISYADRSWTMNNNNTLYDTLGFKIDGITEVNYSYIVEGIRENRFEYRKQKLIEMGFDANKTEHEIMLEQKIYRIYNSGSLKYVYSK